MIAAAIAIAAALELGRGDLVTHTEPGTHDAWCMRVTETFDYAGQRYAWISDVDRWPGRALRVPVADLRPGCKP